MGSFVGRDLELRDLKSWKGDPRLTAIYGRRRIGKTRLVEEASRGMRFLKFEGLEDQSSAIQRRHFRDTLARHSGLQAHSSLRTDRWEDLLIALSEHLGTRQTVVLMDEFQWMASERSELVSTLKYVWDNYFQKNNRIHLILCGSVSSFIVKKVIGSQALFGRIDRKINLRPLSVHEVARGFFPRSSHDQVLKHFMVFGGIPKYLEMCDPDKSFDQNIIDLFFRPLAPLSNELDSLFISHFGKMSEYARVIKFLADKKHSGRSDIIKHIELSSGGGMTQILTELELAGFIETCAFIKGLQRTKEIHYRISDPFLRFVLKFVQPREKKLRALKKPLSILEALPAQPFRVWQGFAFETLCHAHTREIAEALGFGAIDFEVGCVASNKDTPEIDLVFVRADDVLTVCEIKSGERVDRSAIDQVREQIRALELRTRKTVQAAMIARGQVDRAIPESRLFSRIIGIEALFRDPGEF